MNYNEKSLLHLENRALAIMNNIYVQHILNNKKLSDLESELRNNTLLNPVFNKIARLGVTDAIYYIGREHYPLFGSKKEEKDIELFDYTIAYFLFFAEESMQTSAVKSAELGISRRVAYEIYGSAATNRAVRTMSNALYNKAMKKTYDFVGVEFFRFQAIIDNRTSEVCREMNGQILTSNNVSSWTPPLHPHCRSRLVPVKRENVDNNKLFKNYISSPLQNKVNWFKQSYKFNLDNINMTEIMQSYL